MNTNTLPELTSAPAPIRHRKITGMSAILLPMTTGGEIDWTGFESHVIATLDAGLTPAINMDTGYANLISDDIRDEALSRTNAIADGRSYLGGVFVGDGPDASFDADAYRRGIEQIQCHQGTPIFFQSFGLTSGDDDAIFAAYDELAKECESFYAFELGTMFAPFGKIYSLSLYERLMGIKNCLGAKHSSLDRILEWRRLELRNRIRPDFKVLTGNDLAIDMVMYGSDYLLGLSTFCPAEFALRDSMWENGDPRFYALNDLLQYLGAFAFRAPVPAYKHTAAMFLHARGKIASNQTYPGSPERPASDQAILDLISQDLVAYL
ncbi:dihydrodipicolinate synthase family protein [Rhodopirellula sp. JC740]|uniref:Dihydrodipicolinate synthase family protein n=1 Tax=Rhodopirellula halodulae TaxID=2894198 RepID=A0ABS8NHX6_9BACT|nr:dihydrodipicolinate synthase family protein [Rhodopirellula sp. JC740]MCC9643150.1 dihydrodipicolinate synthase family protein [Rhodopirellula sp. JC740]